MRPFSVPQWVWGLGTFVSMVAVLLTVPGESQSPEIPEVTLDSYTQGSLANVAVITFRVNKCRYLILHDPDLGAYIQHFADCEHR